MSNVVSGDLSHIHLLPVDVLLKIVGDLTPEDKKALALTSRVLQKISEDADLLRHDFNAGKTLSVRQLSVIFQSTQDEDLRHKIAIACFKNSPTELRVSENHMKELLNTFVSRGPQFGWVKQLTRLMALEKGVRHFPDFSIVKVTKIFVEHIGFMKSQGFDVNEELLSQDQTPLGFASLFKCPILIRSLVQAGADVNRRNHSGRMPIHLACFPYSLVPFPQAQEIVEECIHTLLELGADIDGITASSWEGQVTLTALSYAAHFGQEATVRTLVTAGADIEFQTNHIIGVSTPLHVAAYEGRYAVVKTLIELGADPLACNQKNKTAFNLAEEQGRSAIASFLSLLSIRNNR